MGFLNKRTVATGLPIVAALIAAVVGASADNDDRAERARLDDECRQKTYNDCMSYTQSQVDETCSRVEHGWREQSQRIDNEWNGFKSTGKWDVRPWEKH